MATPTIAEVKDIKSTTLSDDAITARITSAGIIVGRINDQCGTSYTTSELEEIQLWLAAHFVAISDPDAKREKINSLEIDIENIVGDLGRGILSTFYGQTANALAGGCLVDVTDAKRAVAQFA